MALGLGTHALVLGLTMAGITLAVQAWYLHAAAQAWQTIVLTTLCFSQLGHVLAIRSERTSLFTLGLATNLPLLGAVLLTIALQLGIIYVPALGSIFKTMPLTIDQLLVCIGSGVLVFGIVEIEKWARRSLLPLPNVNVGRETA